MKCIGGCDMPEDLCACDQSLPPDLAPWRAEAGACAPLDAAATRGPWRSTWGDDKPPGETVEDDIAVEAVGRTGIERIVVGALWYDGPNSACRAEDAAFIAAARTGWPRDAARVARLCDEVATLRAALGEALDVAESLLSVATTYCCMTSDSAEIDRLRALAAGSAPPKGESR